MSTLVKGSNSLKILRSTLPQLNNIREITYVFNFLIKYSHPHSFLSHWDVVTSNYLP